MNENLKEQINELKTEIDALRPLDKDTEGRIEQKFRLDWNYHSNNIEGNRLTFGETKTFLLHGITADGKPLKDHLDIKGHNTALEMLEDAVKDGRDLNETFIRELHEIILHEPYDKPAITTDGKQTSKRISVGKYKTDPNHVITTTGETFYFAKPEETPAKMNDLMDWFNSSIKKRTLHPVEQAALLHYKFICIHPFDDGNGRLSRILMNLTLMKFGFPPVIIKTQEKEIYYRALQQADGGDSSFFVDYISKLAKDSLELYLRGAKGERIEEENDVDKEIALFKASIQKSQIKIERSLSTQRTFYTTILKPFLIDFNKKLSQFNTLFENVQFFTSSDIEGYKGVYYFSPDLLDLLQTNYFSKTVHFDTIKVGYSWKKFDNPGYNEFNLETIIRVKISRYKYSISDNSNTKSITKTLDTPISENESQEFISFITKETLTQIETESVKKKK